METSEAEKRIDAMAKEAAKTCERGIYAEGMEDGYYGGYFNAYEKAMEIYEEELRQMKSLLNMVKKGAGELISLDNSRMSFSKKMTE